MLASQAPLSQLLNPNQVFHYSDSTLGRHYGFLVVDISPHPDDPNTWKATSGRPGSIPPGRRIGVGTRSVAITTARTPPLTRGGTRSQTSGLPQGILSPVPDL